MLRSVATGASYYGPKAIIGKRIMASKAEGGEMDATLPAILCGINHSKWHILSSPL